MTRATIAGGAFATVLVLLALAAGWRALERDVDPAVATSPAVTPSTAAAPEEGEAEDHQGFLYGRVTTRGGATYEGRLRWGSDEEAFWGDYFNGFKDENPWVANVPLERLPKERRPIVIFGVEIAHRERQIGLGRFFMARFGEIARIEARGRDVRVTLKSGTVFDLDRFEASDFDDGLRVGTAGGASSTSTVCGSAPSSSSPPSRSAPPPTGCTARCARGRATSPASSSGTGRRASAPTSSTAAPPTARSACLSTPSAPSRAARATAP